MDDWTSPATNEKTFARKTQRLVNYPDYLLIQLRKFSWGADWTPIKHDVEVTMPDELDLAAAKAKGKQDGEVLLPDTVGTEPILFQRALKYSRSIQLRFIYKLCRPFQSNETAAPAPIVPDDAIVAQLTDMGFDINGCKKACVNTKNAGIEAAMNWVMEHMGDADFAAPYVQEQAAGGGGARSEKESSSTSIFYFTSICIVSAFVADPDALANIIAMGIPEKQAKKALRETANNVERAIDWVFSHPDDMGDDEPQVRLRNEQLVSLRELS